jgi:NADH dehydrogenase [ubiquinone] 1 alpha subcomplex assembly factor 7
MEVCPSGLSLAHDIAERVTRVGGAALIVDFVANYLDFSLQAVRGHDHHDPLMSPGSADLACAVNFAALSKVARTAGALVHGPRGQGAFFESLGISSRAERLAQGVSAETSQMIHSGRRRLTEPGFMGELFQAMAITSGSLVSVAGFEPT